MESTMSDIIELPNLDETESITAGLSSIVGSVEPSESFGDSGDVFDHLFWRSIFIVLGNTKAGLAFIMGLAQRLLLRGQSDKKLNKGKAVKLSFKFSDLTDLERQNLKEFIAGKEFLNFYLNFPTDVSRVNAKDLTPERLKCCIRHAVAPQMMSAKRFPATSMSIGYGKLVRDYHVLISTYGDAANLHEEMGPKSDDQIMKDIPDLSPREVMEWRRTAQKIIQNSVTNYMTLIAAYAGSVSSKEIYPYDENLIPGVTFWSGLHAAMTDISNKSKAKFVTKDKREQFQESNFYDDFKRKMVARKMSIINTPIYISFLTTVSNLLPLYIFSSTQIKTEEEVQILDSVMDQVLQLRQNAEGMYKKMSSDTNGTLASDNASLITAAIKEKTKIKSTKSQIKKGE